MPTMESLQALVFATIEDLNKTRSADERLSPAADTPLYGKGGCLDSLGLLDLLMFLERRLAKERGSKVCLITSRTSLERNNPFESVATLVDYLACTLEPLRKAA